MLQVIKYYMTHKYGLLLQIIVLIYIFLYSIIVGREFADNITFITSGLLIAYWSIFTGFVKKKENDTLSEDLPISKTVLNSAKYISYYLNVVFYFAFFAVYALITGLEILPIMNEILETVSFTFVFASISGKVVFLKPNVKVENILHVVYILLGVFGIYYLFSSPSPDHINLNGYIPHLDYLLRNLAVLLLFTSLDFFTMYLNRNKLSVA